MVADCLVLEVHRAVDLGAERQAVLDRVEALGGSLAEGDGYLRVTVPTVEAAAVPGPRGLEEPAPAVG